MSIRSIRASLGLAASLGAAAFSLGASAHDFWVQPLYFWVPPNSPVMTTLQVGHGEFRQRWNADAKRVIRFNDIGPGGVVTDHQAELRAGTMNQDHLLTFRAPGTHVLVLQTSYAESVLPSIRFNDYLKQEGLTPALELRARTRTQDQPGREMYSRRAKALVQVGPPSAKPQPWVTRPVGLSLEIVPEINPYAVGAGVDLPVYVLWNGKRLPGAMVMLNNLAFDGRPLETFVTDANGHAVFRVPRTGSWQLNVLWTQPIKGNPRADFDTTFSSLTLGFPPGVTR
ncbi:MAG: DUF4198 domain-containing protein [Caulobacterales bacterium]